MYRTTVDPIGHESVQSQRGGYGSSLEVLGLARGVLRDIVRRNVEARETGQAAQNEEGETYVVGWGAHANGKSHDCGG